jgi:hypothetical protein
MVLISMKYLLISYLNQKKKAIEFKDKQKSMRKKHDCRAVKYNYKYFKGVTENEIN